jgi:hypothetical protein
MEQPLWLQYRINSLTAVAQWIEHLTTDHNIDESKPVAAKHLRENKTNKKKNISLLIIS